MKKWIFAGLFLATGIFYFVGCQEQQASTKSVKSKSAGKRASVKGPLLLTVDFNSATELKYDFVSERQISINLDPSGRYSKGGKSSQTQNTTEKLEMQITYKALQIDPYGYSTIEAKCNSAKVTRTSSNSRGQERADAVESLAGKTFTLKITPTGKIADYSSLGSIVKELGDKAFGGDPKRGRVKSSDMIMDFIATQWGIWDTIASIENPVKGLKKGQRWESQLLAPMPFVSKIGRNVEYELAGVVKTDNISYAEITSSYSLGSPPADVPMPYTGSFQMRGMFGFLQGYKVLSIEGSGKQLYDIERGLVKSDTQQYKAKVSASIMGLGNDALEPNIEVNQIITMTLVE
ncbi:MAG: hypothetical protein WC496_07900 [Phycisphaerae bacterium]|jgi:hypothetical protein